LLSQPVGSVALLWQPVLRVAIVFQIRPISGQQENSPIAKDKKDDLVRINDQIRVRQVRVIDEEGVQLGIMSPRDALREAEGRGFDLVEVAPQATPPVCRIMDYGKYRYEQKRRARESRKHQTAIAVKEIKYRPKIDKHDFETKTNHVRAFLQEGNKVRITIMFRGREMAHPEFGREIIGRVIEATADLCTGENTASLAKLEGRNMSLMLTPSKQQP
jgi:translation initiation factor IF-3